MFFIDIVYYSDYERLWKFVCVLDVKKIKKKYYIIIKLENSSSFLFSKFKNSFSFKSYEFLKIIFIKIKLKFFPLHIKLAVVIPRISKIL